MKLPHYPLIAALVLGLAGVVSTPSTARAAEMDKGAKELAKMDDNWAAVAAKRDVDALMSFYADDAVAYPPNAPMASGREEIKKVWTAGFADPSFSISWKTSHAGMAKSGDLGYTTGTYVAQMKGPDGNVATEHGKYVCVWKKDAAGKWKAIHDTWNSDSK